MAAAAVAAASAPSSGGLSSEANSYINLGKFETMGGDQGRMAMGIAYLEEQIHVMEMEYAQEANARRKSAKALGLAQNRLQVGRQHHQQQDPNEAISQYKRALELIQDCIKARATEEDAASKKAVTYASFVMSEICSGLGVAFNDVGRQDEALEMLNKTLALRKAMVGKDHASVAECLNNLGALYFSRQAYQKSVEHYEQALELLTNASGGNEENPYIALTYYNVGLCRGHLGQVQAALLVLRKALKLAENSLGSDHPQVTLIKETIKQATGPPPAEPKQQL